MCESIFINQWCHLSHILASGNKPDTQCIQNAFESEDLDFLSYYRQNLVGYASDGEPVMAGKNNGLIALIRKDAKNFIQATHGSQT